MRRLIKKMLEQNWKIPLGFKDTHFISNQKHVNLTQICCGKPADLDFLQTNWTELLPFAEVVYNNFVHSSTGFTPFQVAIWVVCAYARTPSRDPLITLIAEWVDTLKATGS